MKKKKKKLHLKKKYQLFFVNLGIVLLLVLLGNSIYRIGKSFYYERKANQLQEKMVEDVLEKKMVDDEEVLEEVHFDKLEDYNQDIIGWISVPKTNINYPIVQGRDNDYYLTHDIDKKYNIYGSIYMNSYNHADFSDANTVLFGHNTYKDSMFSDVVRIYRGEYGSEVSIFIYTKEHTYEYLVYSSYLTDDMDSSPLNIQTSFFERNEGVFGTHERGSQTLTLSTCLGDDEKRVIVHAVLKSDKNLQEDVES